MTTGLRHDLFVYDDDDEFLHRMVPWVREGVDCGEAVLLVGGENLNPLCEAVGFADGMLTRLDADAVYTRPEAAIAEFDRALRRGRLAGASATRAIGELPHRGTEDEWRPWLAFEAIANRAFARHDAWMVCPYDARALPDTVIEAMHRSHPEVLLDSWEESPGYAEPELLVRELTPAAKELEGLPEVCVTDDPRTFRDALRREMDAALVPDYDASKMLVAAGELYGAAHRRGAGGARLSAGRVGGRFVCELTTPGGAVDDPLAGYVPPAPGTTDGVGLWIARQLTERLEILHGLGAVTIRLWI